MSLDIAPHHPWAKPSLPYKTVWASGLQVLSKFGGAGSNFILILILNLFTFNFIQDKKLMFSSICYLD